MVNNFPLSTLNRNKDTEENKKKKGLSRHLIWYRWGFDMTCKRGKKVRGNDGGIKFGWFRE